MAIFVVEVLVKRIPTVVALALVPGCMFGPFDGQQVATTTTPITAWGVHPLDGADIVLEARSVDDGQFRRVASASAVQGPTIAFGAPWFGWGVTSTVPSWGWTRGITGSRAEVRTMAEGETMTSFPAYGRECVEAFDGGGETYLTAEASCSRTATRGSAFLFTPDYRALPTITQQAQIDYPRGVSHDNTNDFQGLTSSADHWFFAANHHSRLMRIPIDADLADSDSWGAALTVGMPPELAAIGLNHFGDPDEHLGMIYVPVEGNGRGTIAVFDLDLQFLGSATVDQPDAPWVAIDPVTGWLYTSRFCGVQYVDAYEMAFDDGGVLTDLRFAARRYLSEPGGVARDAASEGSTRTGTPQSDIRAFPVEETLGTYPELTAPPPTGPGSVPLTVHGIQGGAFSDHGNLFLLASREGYEGCDGDYAFTGLHGFEGATMRREVFLPFEIDDDITGQEVGGVDVRDVTGRAPGITGQIHAGLNDQDAFDDDVYIKHFEADPAELGRL